MKAVVDTNVIVSGLLSVQGAPGAIMRMIIAGDIELCIDARILEEYEEVLLRPKFGFDPNYISLILDYIRHSSRIVAAGPLKERLPDKDDEPFAEVAVASGADCLITGNSRHYPAKTLGKVKVLTPDQFISKYRSR